jgi:hypothetical protein
VDVGGVFQIEKKKGVILFDRATIQYVSAQCRNSLVNLLLAHG